MANATTFVRLDVPEFQGTRRHHGGGVPEKGAEKGVFSYLFYRRIPIFGPPRSRLGNHLSPDSRSPKKSDLN